MGHALLRGYPDHGPGLQHAACFLADACGGATGAFALMAALRQRMQTGEGQFIDMSQAENVAHALSQAFMDYSMNGRVQATLGNRDRQPRAPGRLSVLGRGQLDRDLLRRRREFAALCERHRAARARRPTRASPKRSAATTTRTSSTRRSSAWTRRKASTRAVPCPAGDGRPRRARCSQPPTSSPTRSCRRATCWQDVTLPSDGHARRT